jgi:4-hydroxybenzoate polyprenyltransferase
MDTPRGTRSRPIATGEVEGAVAGYLFISAFMLTALLIVLIRAAESWQEFRGLLARIIPPR